MQIPTTPDLPPPGAHALPMASLIDSRDCPVCGKSLKGRQRVCSGACRAKLSRQKKDTEQAQRDRQLREMLEEALGLVQRLARRLKAKVSELLD